MAEALIVDTSVLVATLLEDEPEHDLAIRLMSHAAIGNVELTAVAYAKVEVVSALVRAVRRSRVIEGQLRSPDRILAAFPVNWAPVEPILPRAMEMALKEGFSVYDALPVAQAEMVGLHLLTLDEPQRERALLPVRVRSLSQVVTQLDSG
ncbi:MAG: hypothetical protein C0506_11755 [Anaerolinea sp.]|nr:hypothetical protein [Anaerolinea sp.]